MAEAKTEEKKTEETKAAVAQSESTAVTTAQSNDLAVPEQSLDDMLMADAGAGSEFIGMNERVIPFMAVLQNGSPQVAKGGPDQIKGAESSDLYNTLTKKVVHSNVAEPEKGQGVLFLPVHFKVKPIEWYRRNAEGGGGGLARIWGEDDSYKRNGLFVFDAKRNRWVNNETNSEISDHYETYGIWVGDFDKSAEEGKGDLPEALLEKLNINPMPCVVSMKGSQIKKARAWNSERLMRRMSVQGRSMQAPAFYDAWRVQTKYEQNAEGNWFGYTYSRFATPDVTPQDSSTLALPSGRDLYLMAREMYQDIQAGLITTDDSQLHGTDDQTAAYSDTEVPF